MRGLQVACIAIVALYVTFRLKTSDPWAFAARFLTLSLGAFVGENSMIHLYGFYGYGPLWWLFIDRVPLLVVLIWPVVIDSAMMLARHVAGPSAPAYKWLLLTFLFVLSDAALIEPIAVTTGLWFWTHPGLFRVPPIGILGWAYFSVLAAVTLHATRGRGPVLRALAVLLVAPLGCHALLLASWWGGLRFVDVTLAPRTVAAVALVLGLVVAGTSLVLRIRRRVPPWELWVRAPAAAFFFVLLFAYADGGPFLVPYAVAFAVPYLTLLRLPSRQPG